MPPLSVVITTTVPAGEISVTSRSWQAVCVMPVVRLTSHRYAPKPLTCVVKLSTEVEGITPPVPEKLKVCVPAPLHVGAFWNCGPFAGVEAALAGAGPLPHAAFAGSSPPTRSESSA
jgi:hypothetical protein